MTKRAFTLIELLVVVAIIAILAAIAIPNLLHAQTRSKVARAKADLRTMALGIESYTVDYQQPPLDYNVGRGDPLLPGMTPTTSGVLHPGSVINGAVSPGLTTPVAYVSDCWLTDPFVGFAGYDTIPFDQQKFTYNWFGPNPNRGVPVFADYAFRRYDAAYGYWRLGSIGPDRDFFNGRHSVFAASIVYDPTNGTVSMGNVWRSQKEPDVTTRPPGDDLLDP